MLLEVRIIFGKSLSPLVHHATLTAVAAPSYEGSAGDFTIDWTEGSHDSGGPAPPQCTTTQLADWAALTSLFQLYQPRQLTVALTASAAGKTVTSTHTFQYEAVMRHQVELKKSVNEFARELDSDYETEDDGSSHAELWAHPSHNSFFWEAVTQPLEWQKGLRTASRMLALRPLLVNATCPVALGEPLLLGKTYYLPCAHLISKDAWMKIRAQSLSSCVCDAPKCPLCRAAVFTGAVLIE